MVMDGDGNIYLLQKEILVLRTDTTEIRHLGIDSSLLAQREILDGDDLWVAGIG